MRTRFTGWSGPQRKRVFGCVLLILMLLFPWSKYSIAEQDKQKPEKTATTKALETGAALLQSKPPIETIDTYLDGFHFVNGDMKNQMEAHHYCAVLSEDFIQCVLMDNNSRVAHLIGVEYVISRKAFESLPAEERKLWHSHAYEVKSGQLIGPGLPDAAEKELMKKLVSTYGKTWQTWTNHTENIPTGIPQLMMGFTSDGQLHNELLTRRDQQLHISTDAKRSSREDIVAPPVLPGANMWMKKQVVQLKAEEKK